MKSALLLGLLFFTTVLNAQDLDSLTYEQANDPAFFPTISNGVSVGKYITSNGAVFKLKDTLIIGKPTLANQRSFDYIIMGKAGGFGNMMGAMNGDAPAKLTLNYSGQTVLVDEIKVYHNGSKKKPLKFTIRLGEVNGRAFGVNKYLTINDFELAYVAGEILLKNQPMTRAEAIAKLKEAKDLLDLGMMTQEKFDKMKADLSKIIINK